MEETVEPKPDDPIKEAFPCKCGKLDCQMGLLISEYPENKVKVQIFDKEDIKTVIINKIKLIEKLMGLEYNTFNNANLICNLPLNQKSIIFDVGGYKGDWAAEVIDKYDPFVFIFEPVPKFFKIIENKFRNNPKVKIYNFGLYDKNSAEKMVIAEDGSSIFIDGEEKINVEMRDIADFLEKEKIENIDLIGINIEGGEYKLLKRMIETGIIKKCRALLIQFHASYPNAKKLRDDIIKVLEETHFNIWSYPFVWEKWRKKDAIK